MIIELDSTKLLNSKEFEIFRYQDKLLVSKKLRKYGILVNKKLILSEDLLKALFVIWGDGHYKSKLNLTNHEYRIHNFVLDTFEKELEINRIIWKLRILHHSNENKNLMEKVKKYWLLQLGFTQEQLYPKISHEKLKTNRLGIARIQIDKLIYADVIKEIIEYVISRIANNNLTEREVCTVLDGILNAEGNVLQDFEGIHRITISFNKNERKLFKAILQNLNIYAKIGKRDDRFLISRWQNIYDFFKPFVSSDVIPFSLRPQDSYNLIFGFLNHKRTKALRNYLETIEKYPNKYFKQIATLSKRHWKSAKVTLQIRNKDFVDIKKIGGRYPTNLSDEGKNLLKVIRTLENWLPSITENAEQDYFDSEEFKEVIRNLAS